MKAEVLVDPGPIDIEPQPDLLAQVGKALERYPQAVAGLKPTARRIYAVLLAVGLARLKALGARPGRSLAQVVAFLPNEALMGALGIPERSLYRALRELREAGLIASRVIYSPATIRGWPGVYAAGVVHAVRLPHKERRPRLYPEDLRHPWRDLQADIEAGRTVWADLKAWYGGKANMGRVLRKRRQEAKTLGLAESSISPLRGDAGVLQYLLGWALPPVGEAKGPIDMDSAKSASAAFLSQLLRAKPAHRRRLVEEVALGLAKEWQDPGGTRFYAWAIWGAFRAEVYGYGPGAMRVLLWAIWRVRLAVRSGGVRRPGALLATLLKAEGVLALFRQAPPWRVA